MSNETIIKIKKEARDELKKLMENNTDDIDDDNTNNSSGDSIINDSFLDAPDLNCGFVQIDRRTRKFIKGINKRSLKMASKYFSFALKTEKDIKFIKRKLAELHPNGTHLTPGDYAKILRCSFPSTAIMTNEQSFLKFMLEFIINNKININADDQIRMIIRSTSITDNIPHFDYCVCWIKIRNKAISFVCQDLHLLNKKIKTHEDINKLAGSIPNYISRSQPLSNLSNSVCLYVIYFISSFLRFYHNDTNKTIQNINITQNNLLRFYLFV